MQATPKGLTAELDTAPHPRPVPAFPTPNPEALRLPARGGTRAEAPPPPHFATAQIPEPESVKCGEPAFHTGTVRLKACTQGWRRPTKVSSRSAHTWGLGQRTDVSALATKSQRAPALLHTHAGAASSPAMPASEMAPELRVPGTWLGRYGQAPDCVRDPGTKLPKAQGLPPSSGALPARYSQARLQAEQGARGPRGEQQHQSQGHRAPRRPRLREDGHRARGPAPGPRSGPPLTGGPGGPSEPPPPRAPWPGDAQGAAAGARRARGRRRCGRSGFPARPPPPRATLRAQPGRRSPPAFATPPAQTPARAPPPALTPPRPLPGPRDQPRPQPASGPRPQSSRSRSSLAPGGRGLLSPGRGHGESTLLEPEMGAIPPAHSGGKGVRPRNGSRVVETACSSKSKHHAIHTKDRGIVGCIVSPKE
ncbi:translation initiation factor IF-2-like [Neovison vison]|uniref:translation initiation factor IF-2-like n=1 Tax=Neovison vison TaxID=452646 RepID=UPI001CF00F9A|nr:translation initiation factor IF-2-like [Neogale vison]